MKPRALDLFCCAGGASVGLHRAGFDVVGVDIEYHKNYPFPVIVVDALTIHKIIDFSAFDLVWASPPCQKYSWATPKRCRDNHPDLIEPTRQLLAMAELAGCKTVMENVQKAPMRPDIILDGIYFGLPLERRRIFEVNFFTDSLDVGARTRPERGARTASISAAWNAPGSGRTVAPSLQEQNAPSGRHENASNIEADFAPSGLAHSGLPNAVSVAGKPGGTKGTFAEWQAAMEIDWMTSREIVEAVPPAYAEAIGRCALDAIALNRRAAQ